jgi:hypothetical protein
VKSRYIAAALAVAGLLAIVAGALFLLKPSGEQRALSGAPGLELTYPEGTPIEVDNSNAVLGATAYQVRGYGTDQEQADILGFFDAALDELGYRETAPTPDSMTRFQQHRPLRQYQDGTFTYRLYLLDVPLRLSRDVTISGYHHVLFTELSV